MTYFIALCSVLWVQSSPQDRPKALVAMEQARLRLRTGRIEWSQTLPGRVATRFYTSRWAGEDFIVVHRGDEQGVVHRDENGQPITEWSYSGAEHYLFQRGKIWKHIEHDTGATYYENFAMPLSGWDVRALGTTASIPPAGTGVRDAIHTFGADSVVPTTYRSSKEGKLRKVVADIGDGWAYTWLIDPDRGFNPVRILLKRASSDHAFLESRVTLKKLDGVWFPEVVAIHKGGKTQPFRVIRVLSAAFNRPDQPKELRPEHAGIEVGTNIYLAHPESASSATKAVFRRTMFGTLGWDGEKLIPYMELRGRIAAGELDYGPEFKRESARVHDRNRKASMTRRDVAPKHPPPATQPADMPTIPPTLWEKYVDGIALYCEFTDVQKTSAQAVLKELRRRAEHTAEDKDKQARLFAELRSRVVGLMTPRQRATYALMKQDYQRIKRTQASRKRK